MPVNGRLQVGLGGITSSSDTSPIMNFWKFGDAIQIIDGGVNYYSDIKPGLTSFGNPSAWTLPHLDDNGEIVSPMPATMTHYIRIVRAQPIDGIWSPGFGGQIWRLSFDGTATNVHFGLVAVPDAVRVGNVITFTFPSSDSNMSVIFEGFSNINDPPRNIYFGPDIYASRWAAGETYTDAFIDLNSRMSGEIRFMDWMGTNKNHTISKFTDIPTRSHFYYMADQIKKAGFPLPEMVSLANLVQSHPWFNIPQCFGTYKSNFTITGITQANPAVVTAPKHTFSNGDQVLLWLVGGMNEVNRNTYTVANSDQINGTFELFGIDSTGFSVFTSSGNITTPYNLANITTEVTLFAQYVKDNLSLNLTAAYEFTNEHWNFGGNFTAFHWLAAQARGKFAGDDHIRMYGYLAAHIMATIRNVYGDRTKWRGILGTLVSQSSHTSQLISGAETYLSENPSLMLTDLFDDVAGTGYFGDNIDGNGSADAVTINIGTSTFTKSGHGWLDREPVSFNDNGDTLPTPLVFSPTPYHVVNRTTNTFQVSGTPGGTPVTLGGTQSGTHLVKEARADWIYKVIDDSTTRFNSSLEPTKYAYCDRVVNQDLRDGSYTEGDFDIDDLEIFWLAQKVVTDAKSLGFCMYEGGVSETKFDKSDFFTAGVQNALIKEFHPQWVYSAAGGATHTEMCERFYALTNRRPAKFVDFGPLTRFGYFGAVRYFGESNVLADALIEFNLPSGAVAHASDTVGSHFVAHNLSRKRFREIADALEAQHALEVRAHEAKGKHGKALARAARVAERALNSVDEELTTASRIEDLTRLMQAATSASSFAAIFKAAVAVQKQALIILDEVEAIDPDEEEAMTLLLLT